MRVILGKKIYKKAEDALKNWLIYFLLFSTVVLSVTTKVFYKNSQKYKKDINTITTLRDKSAEYQRVILSQNKEEIVELTNKLLGKDRKLKEVLSLLKTASKIKIKDKPIYYTDSFIKYDTAYILANLDSFIKVPKQAIFKDSSLDIDITLNKEDLIINNLEIKDTTIISVEKVRKNIFKNQYRIRTKSTSPYVQNIQQEAFIYEKKDKVLPKILSGGVLLLTALIFL